MEMMTDDLHLLRDKVRPRTGFRNTMFEFVTGNRRAFRDAAQSGNIGEVMKLHGAGQDIESESNFGATALHKAAAAGQLEVVKYLLENGADPNATHKLGKTAQQEAEMQGHVHVVRYLQEKMTSMSVEEQQHRHQQRKLQRRKQETTKGGEGEQQQQQQQGFTIDDHANADSNTDPNAVNVSQDGDAPLWEWSGLYAKVSVGDTEQCTDALVDDDPVRPEWDELLEPFAVRSSLASTMAHVALFDKRSHLLGQGRREGDLFVGRASLPLASLADGLLHEITLDLVPAGQLKVRVLLATPISAATAASASAGGSMFDATAASLDVDTMLHLQQPQSQPPSPTGPASPSTLGPMSTAPHSGGGAQLFSALEEARLVHEKLLESRAETVKEASRAEAAEAELERERALAARRLERETVRADRAEQEVERERGGDSTRGREGQSQERKRDQKQASAKMREAREEVARERERADQQHTSLLQREQQLRKEKEKSAKLARQLTSLKAQYDEELARHRRKLTELQAQLEAKGQHGPAAAAAAAIVAVAPKPAVPNGSNGSTLPGGSTWANAAAQSKAPVKRIDDAR
jgi:hypothetical protein